MIAAGEASGDQHAAHLVAELKKLDGGLSFSGLGGPRMSRAGVELYEDLTQWAVVGFIEVLKHYLKFKKAFDQFLREAERRKPAAVILVDYPGFNLRLAKELKKRGLKVIYYISPQVWAWKESRVKLIKKVVDKMIVIFPFEKDFYAKHGMDVAYVGHPILDSMQVNRPAPQFLRDLGFSTGNMTIGILPGSRTGEIERHFPIMLQAANLLYNQYNKVQFIVFKAPTVDMLQMEKFFRPFVELPIKILHNDVNNGLNACNLCMVASGTATFETALFEKPMVVVYRTSPFTYFFAKLLMKVRFIGMVNVLAGRKIVPECVQGNATPKKIVKALIDIFSDELKIAEIKSELRRIKEKMGEPGASKRAAEEILKVLQSS